MNASALGLACAAALLACNAFSEEPVKKSVLDFSLESIDGKPYPLSKHKGEVMLIVNVASRCGFTPQYIALEALHAKYHEKGFNVVGVPANEFGKQEPGTNDEIKEFCDSKYHVTFPMLGKVVVKGKGITPLYKYLTTESPKPGPITWNFNKFLIGREGQVVERFESQVKPDDPKLVAAVEKALAEK
jgi:glutathione peroxidase